METVWQPFVSWLGINSQEGLGDERRRRGLQVFRSTGFEGRGPPGIRTPSPPRLPASRGRPAIGSAGTPGRVTEGVFEPGATFDCMTGLGAFRLTQYARGGGCACKIPPGELEETIARLVPDGPGTDLVVGVEHGDDGAVVRVSPAMAVVVTADFFTPVVDDAYEAVA
jgi:hypothetical protein